MSGWASLTGSYTLHPGQPLSISGQRPVLGQGLLTRLSRMSAPRMAVWRRR